jgi:hypothetical protein
MQHIRLGECTLTSALPGCGVAASMAARTDSPVQDFDMEMLQEKLLR